MSAYTIQIIKNLIKKQYLLTKKKVQSIKRGQKKRDRCFKSTKKNNWDEIPQMAQNTNNFELSKNSVIGWFC